MNPVKRLNRIIREARQFIVDVEWWNNNRRDSEPFDCEDMRIILDLALKCRAALRSGDGKEYQRRAGEMSRFAAKEMSKAQ